MKKSHLILLTFLSVASLVSCQAKDEKMARGGSDGDSFSSMNRIELNQMLALSTDRLSEPIHLVKAVLNSQYAAAYNIEILDVSDKATVIAQADNLPLDLSQLKLKSTNAAVNTKNVEPTLKKANLNLNLKRLLIDENGVLDQFVAIKENEESIKNAGIRYDSNKKFSDFTATVHSESFSVVKIAEGIYKVHLNRVDEASSRKDKNSLILSKISFKLAWSGKAADLDEVVKISDVAMLVERKGDKRGAIKIRLDNKKEAAELSLKMSDCASLNGALPLFVQFSDDRGNLEKKGVAKILELNDSSVSVAEDQFTSKAIECNGRPVVDLTRML